MKSIFISPLVIATSASASATVDAPLLSVDRGFIPDDEFVSGQQATGGRLDLNSAYVTDYKELRGLYPAVAGKIASHGPYKQVKDVYTMAGLTKEQGALFKKYEREFTVNPPGRLFIERVNARQSL